MRARQRWDRCARALVGLAANLVQFVGASLRLQAALAAENLFLRKQLALYRARGEAAAGVGPGPVHPCPARTLLRLARGVHHCPTGHAPPLAPRRLSVLLRWRSSPGRPRLPAELQRVIAAMARNNVTWGEERIAAELLRTLGVRVSPREWRGRTTAPSPWATVGDLRPDSRPGPRGL